MHYNTAALSMVKNDWVLVETFYSRLFLKAFDIMQPIYNKRLRLANRRVIGTMAEVPIYSYMQYYSEFETRTHNLGLQV